MLGPMSNLTLSGTIRNVFASATLLQFILGLLVAMFTSISLFLLLHILIVHVPKMSSDHFVYLRMGDYSTSRTIKTYRRRIISDEWIVFQMDMGKTVMNEGRGRLLTYDTPPGMGLNQLLMMLIGQFCHELH